MQRSLIYGAAGCFVGTVFSMYLVQYKPHAFLLILLPMWGLVMGVSIARTVDLYSPKKKSRKKK